MPYRIRITGRTLHAGVGQKPANTTRLNIILESKIINQLSIYIHINGNTSFYKNPHVIYRFTRSEDYSAILIFPYFTTVNKPLQMLIRQILQGNYFSKLPDSDGRKVSFSF